MQCVQQIIQGVKLLNYVYGIYYTETLQKEHSGLKFPKEKLNIEV